MFKLTDSRNLGRSLAVTGLVLGPLLLALGSFLDPAWSEDRATYLTEVAADTGRYSLAGALFTVGALLLVAGGLGLVKLLRGRRLTLGQLGAGLVTFGFIGMSGGMVFNAFDVAMAAEPGQAMLALSERVEDSVPITVYWVAAFFGGIVVGSLLLVAGLLRSRVVPPWSSLLIVAAIVLGFLAQGPLINGAAFLLFGAGLAPLALRIAAYSDDEWEAWELPRTPRQETVPAASAPPTMPAAHT